MKCIKCENEIENVLDACKLYNSKGYNLYICKECSSNITPNEEANEIVIKYRQELEKTKLLISKFLSCAEKSSITNVNKIAQKTRRLSIEIRKQLKVWRQVSLEHEKFLNDIKLNIKEEIKRDGLNV